MYQDKIENYNGRYVDDNNGNFRRFYHKAGPQVAKSETNNETQLTHGSYGGLLFDQRWKLKRVRILTRDNHKCVICDHNDNLHIHHRQYHFSQNVGEFKKPWDYEDHLLITLCETCHRRGHSQYKVPIINVQ